MAQNRVQRPPWVPYWLENQYVLARKDGKKEANFSQEERQQFAHNMYTLMRRSDKTQWSGIFLVNTEPIIYGSKLFEIFLDRIGRHYFRTSYFRLQNYEWLLPQESASPEDLAVFDRLWKCAPTVGDDQVGKVLDLQLLDGKSQVSPAHNHLYMRTFDLEGFQLDDLITYLNRSKGVYDETRDWSIMRNIYRLPSPFHPIIFTLRAIGSVEGSLDSASLLEKQLRRATKEPSIFPEFVSALEKLYPEILSNAKVYFLPGASTSFPPERLGDDTDALLHQAFHYSSLMTRPCTFYGGICPDLGDSRMFRDLKTNIWERFYKNMRQSSSIFGI